MEALPRPTLATGRLVLYYLALLLGAGLIFWGVVGYGQTLQAPLPAQGFGSHSVSHGASALARTLLALAAVMGTSQLLGKLIERLGQPQVMGEVLGGILLGPSLLGWAAPGVSEMLFTSDTISALGTLARIGVVLYMFFVGLELDWKLLRHQGTSTIVISHASIAVPFVLGSLLALWLFPNFASGDVPFHVFSLFLGVSMSVTAFPVLARILTDRKMQRTRLGALALICAAVDDVTAWCLLAVVLAVATASPLMALQTFALSLLFVAGTVFLLRPLLEKLTGGWQDHSAALSAVLLSALLTAACTEAIGIHALFGAFLLGAVIPHDSPLARRQMAHLYTLVSLLLLPAFFAFTGLRTQIGLVQGPGAWLTVVAIITTACLGKFGGTWAAARLCGFNQRTAASLGILMNTRGLMELIVLNLGLELKILSPTLFTMFVLMALTTTFMTTPILRRLQVEEETPLSAQVA